MAEESMDIDNFDPEAVHGGGGYVDDDIDLDDDDDDDDEPLLVSSTRSAGLSSPSLSKGQKRRAKPNSMGPSPDLKKRKKQAPSAHPDDYLLRRAGTGDLRDYVVAKFLTRVPDFSNSPHVRLHRKTEDTARGRQKAIEAHRKQQIYYNSFSGKRRLERYEKQGIVTIPDRYRNGWTLEVTPKHVLEERKRLAEALKLAGGSRSTAANGVANSAAGVNGVKGKGGDEEQKSHDPDVDVFDGKFDGKSTSRYAIMVMTEGSKAVDVIPIDDYSWCSFRAKWSQGQDDADQTEAKMRKYAVKGQSRMAKFSTKLESAQFAREQGMGDNSRIVNSKEYAGVGIKRGAVKNEDDVENAEELDFEEEFDNDDVAQLDKESVKKTENKVVGDAAQNAKDLRKLIKDEPITSRPSSPTSDSDDEPNQGKNSRPVSRSPSPSRPSSALRSPSRSLKSTPAVGSRQPTPVGMSPYGSTPRSPGGNTPQKLDLSHLLPPPGRLPSSSHIKAVLSVLLKTRERIMFKEFLQYFETKTREQKSNLTSLMKAVANVTQEAVGGHKRIYISWKKPQVPAGPSGR